MDPMVKNFPIVCVGGSAGGLDAYILLLQNLPPDMGVAIAIVNHITSMPTHLHKVLPRFAAMPVDLMAERLGGWPAGTIVTTPNWTGYARRDNRPSGLQNGYDRLLRRLWVAPLPANTHSRVSRTRHVAHDSAWMAAISLFRSSRVRLCRLFCG